MHSWNTFGAQTSHGQTRIHKIHHKPDSGEATTSPFQYSLCLASGPTPKCHFVLGLSSWSSEILKIRTPMILEAHNFVCRPPIEVRSIEKLQSSLKFFQWYVARHLHVKKSGQFLTFSAQKSNQHHDFRPLFWP